MRVNEDPTQNYSALLAVGLITGLVPLLCVLSRGPTTMPGIRTEATGLPTGIARVVLTPIIYLHDETALGRPLDWCVSLWIAA